MPRRPRSIVPGATYHLISRFVDREWFINKPYERELYLKLLGRALVESDWRLTTYGVMNNHIHLESVAGEEPRETWIRRVHAPFADTMNRAYNRIGSVFVRGPSAHYVDPVSFGHVLAYIHNNPVRAGVCSVADGTDWTSHRAYIGQATVPPWLHVREGMARAGFDDAHAFDEWVNDPAREAQEAYSEDDYERRATEERAATDARARCATSAVALRIVRLTAEVVGIALSQLRSTSRGAAEVLARAVAVRSAELSNVSGCAIADALALSPSGVSSVRRRPLSKEVLLLSEHVDALVRDQEASAVEGV